ncbi:MAG: LacI family transcriptional regulator, partial [Planctomycetaceae bacterium]|nr:LacI family transcriptional regulator [Planctomycetaceae bacterium]
MQKNVTIRDVAREAGVSVATVSRALNQNYPVSDKLRQRIDAAVAKLDFHPNAIARTLKTNNTGIIGFLVSDISQNFFTTILKGVENIIQTSNYNVISCSTDNQKSTELSYLNILLEKKVDGIILNGTGMNDEYIAKISKTVPIVCSHRSNSSPDFFGDFVGCDEFNSIQQLTSHLLALGHRKIGLLNGPLHVSTGHDRYQGFCAAMRAAGVE